MIVVSKKNIILPGPNGEKFRLAKDYMGPVPAWAEKSAYLQALVDDKKVIVSGEKAKKSGKKSPPDPPADPPAGDTGETE